MYKEILIEIKKQQTKKLLTMSGLLAEALIARSFLKTSCRLVVYLIIYKIPTHSNETSNFKMIGRDIYD